MTELKAKPGGCEEASPLSHNFYIPCNAPAVHMVKTGDAEPYRMCASCAAHNVSNRGAKIIGEFKVTESAITHYPSSKGLVAIADMTWPHLNNAIAKVRREGGNPALLAALEFNMSQRPAKDPDVENAPKVERTAPTQGIRVGGGLGGGVGSRKLERADGSETTVRDNNPPPEQDTFLETVQEKHADLLGRIADHEMAKSALPKVVNTEEEMAAITAWNVKTGALVREAETARVGAKEPYLERGRWIDGLFNGIKTTLSSGVKPLEERIEPFLKAKRIAEQAARDAAAKAAREEQQRKDEEARKAREAEMEAARKAEAAAQAIRDAANAEERRKAEIATREAEREANIARLTAERAEEHSAWADKAADKAEARADGGHELDRTVAGGGAVKLKMVPKFRITDPEAVRRSLGPLAPYLAKQAVEDAIARASREEAWPRVPGVTFYEEEEVSTTATRR